jgi:hypothetical protein
MTAACTTFFETNTWLLTFTVAVGVFAYGYLLTHLVFGIDEEVAWQTPWAHEIWLEQRRWGMYVLQRFVLSQIVYPFTGVAVAILFLSVSCALLVHRAGGSRAARAIFCGLFISFPAFAHIQYFGYMAAHVAFAVLLVVIAERLLAASGEGSRARLGLALCLLTFAVASHQSLLFVFLTIAVFSLADAAFRNEVSPRAAMARLGLTAALMVGSVVLYYTVDKLIGRPSTGYVEGFVRWGSTSWKDVLSELWTASTPYLTGEPNTYALVPAALIPIVGLVVLARRTERPLVTTVLTVLFAASPLAIHVVFGTWMATRSLIALPFAYAGLWYLFFCVGGSFFRAGTAVFAVCSVILHSSLISKISLAQELAYRADAMIASRVLELIYDARPRLAEEGTPLAFVGLLDPPHSKLFVEEETFGASFWQWEGGNPYRMWLFLSTLGLPQNVALAMPSEWPRARALSADMPAWPDKDCVQFRDGLVIVKPSSP